MKYLRFIFLILLINLLFIKVFAVKPVVEKKVTKAYGGIGGLLNLYAVVDKNIYTDEEG